LPSELLLSKVPEIATLCPNRPAEKSRHTSDTISNNFNLNMNEIFSG